jgi:hypothetical protein
LERMKSLEGDETVLKMEDKDKGILLNFWK